MLSACDEIQHKINQTLASLIPEMTQYSTPEHLFSAKWFEDDGAWEKITRHAMPELCSGLECRLKTPLRTLRRTDVGIKDKFIHASDLHTNIRAVDRISVKWTASFSPADSEALTEAASI